MQGPAGPRPCPGRRHSSLQSRWSASRSSPSGLCERGEAFPSLVKLGEANPQGLQESSAASSLGLTLAETNVVCGRGPSGVQQSPGIRAGIPFQRGQGRPFQGQDGPETCGHPLLLDSRKGGIFAPILCPSLCPRSLLGDVWLFSEAEMLPGAWTSGLALTLVSVNEMLAE